MTPSGKVAKPDRAVVSSVANQLSSLLFFFSSDSLTTYTDYYYRLRELTKTKTKATFAKVLTALYYCEQRSG